MKVSLSSSTIVQQILRKSRSLSRFTNHKTLYLAPDCSAEDPAKQRTIFSEFKRRKIDEPNLKNLLTLRGGTVVSVETATK